MYWLELAEQPSANPKYPIQSLRFMTVWISDSGLEPAPVCNSGTSPIN